MKTDDSLGRRGGFGVGLLVAACGVVFSGCQSNTPMVEGPISVYRDRMLAEQAQAAAQPAEPRVRPVAWQEEMGERAALIAQPAVEDLPAPDDVLGEMPDPSEAAAVYNRRLDKLRQDQAGQPDQRVVRNYEQVLADALRYLEQLRRPVQVELSLAECVQRALDHSYSIRYEAYGPAISQTQIVEAEAAFDVEFFLDTTYAKLDQATASTFVPGTSDTRSLEGGFRKLLPSGMQTSVALKQQRSKNDLPREFQELNPVYDSSFVAQFRQPLLRGFGLDVNRSSITVARLDHHISRERFIQKVRDTLFDVESAYWQLVRARRTVAIFAESVAQNHVTYQNMRERLGHDATQVEVANAESRWKTEEVRYLETLKLVRDAEDRLKNLMNDPDFKLSEHVELIPTEVPVVAPLAVDLFAVVRTALDRRSEIRELRQRIEQARVQTMVTKNQILPQLDVSFQYEVQGLGDTPDNSFDNLTTNRFISFTVMASFAYNFGERKARAAHHRARLQEGQAVVGLNQVSDGIVEEVNQTVRTLMVRYEQLPPALLAVKATERNLRSLQARTQQINPTFLQTELQTVEQLANTRSTLLQVVTDYNVGVVQLEKAQGTLLDYNNVVVADAVAGQ